MNLVDYKNALKKNPDDENLKKEYYKRCYELFDSVNTGEERQEIAYEERIGYYAFRNNAREYYEKYVEGVTDDRTWFEKYVRTRKYDRKLLYLRLIQEENVEKIIELIKNSGMDRRILKSDIINFVVSNFSEEEYYLIDNLRKKIDIYIDYENNTKKELKQQQNIQKEQETNIKDREIFDAKRMVLENFINGVYDNKQQYCKIYKIDVKVFDELVDLAKMYDNDLYQRYEEVININESTKLAVFTSGIKNLIYYLENGINEENGIVRAFDLIDYYLLIKLDFEVVLDAISNINLTVNELRLIKTFISKNKDNVKDKSNDIQHILSPASKQIIGGRVIELYEKELILNFLKKNKIPKNNITYNIALRRYLNNTLPIEEKQKKL